VKDWRVSLGVLVGVLAAAVFVIAGGHRAPPVDQREMPAHGPVLSDCDGAIERLVIQYVPEAAPIVETAYRQFLGALPAAVTVVVVCPDEEAFEDFRSRVGDVSCRLVPVLTGHAMTCWSRDRWLATSPAQLGGQVLVISPLVENAAAIWPQREGDSRIGDDLARALPDDVISHRSALVFDGGDFVADNETVFVTPRVARRNVGVTVASLDELRRELARIVKRRVVLLDDAPPHHAGMFMMLAGNRTAVVGDPSLAAALAPAGTPADTDPWPLDHPDFSETTQRRFDAVAARCKAAGYRVVRIPGVPGRDGRTYLTYLNVILDERGGRRAVYMPVYEGAESVNDAVEAVWRKLGFGVHRIDCTNTYKHFGSLRCLVNVLRR